MTLETCYIRGYGIIPFWESNVCRQNYFTLIPTYCLKKTFKILFLGMPVRTIYYSSVVRDHFG